MTSIDLKTPQQIAIMKAGGQKLNRIKKTLIAMAIPGIKLEDIEKKAMEMIKKAGGKASFAMVNGYKWATCINLNEGLVHGVPDSKIIKQGDIVSIDCGLYLNNFHTDTSFSFIVGNPEEYPQKDKLLKAGQKALMLAISQAKVGNRIGHVSKTTQDTIESYGYNVARNLTGHGIGKKLHEMPSVPCFLDKPLNQTPLIKPGLTIAIEAIYMAGSYQTITDPADNWTIITKDGSNAAMFEETVAVTKSGPIILT